MASPTLVSVVQDMGRALDKLEREAAPALAALIPGNSTYPHGKSLDYFAKTFTSAAYSACVGEGGAPKGERVASRAMQLYQNKWREAVGPSAGSAGTGFWASFSRTWNGEAPPKPSRLEADGTSIWLQLGREEFQRLAQSEGLPALCSSLSAKSKPIS